MSGLTPLWLMVLAAILAVLVGIGGGASQLAVYEVLRDFQTLIAAFIAMGVGYYAARPVYDQLKEARRQSSAVLHAMYTDRIELLTQQIIIANECLKVAQASTGLHNNEAHRDRNTHDVSVWLKEFDRQINALDKLQADLRDPRIGTASSNIRSCRNELFGRMVKVRWALVRQRRALKKLKDIYGPLVPREVVLEEIGNDVKQGADSMYVMTKAYRTIAVEEADELRDKADRELAALSDSLR